MLRLENLSCGYGAMRALHDLTLEVPTGSALALIGANGAGKTSTLMAIAGHVEVFGGTIVHDGEDITRRPARERVHRGIAIAPEGRQLFPDLTVEENLIVGGYTKSPAIHEENRAKVLSLFPRLSERLNSLAGQLSGGEQQMLAIGRALMAEPTFLMIDEVSLGLMPAVVDICYDAMTKLRAEGMTIMLVEQSTKRALEIADHVCVLESGVAVWQGTAASARNDPDMIDAYLGLKS